MNVSAGLKKRVSVILYIATFLVMEVVFGYFLLESRHLFMENSVKHGSYLAQAQIEKIETRMGEYAFSVELAGKYLDEMAGLDLTEGEVQAWMKSYCEKITARFGDNLVDLYAVLDGKIVAAIPWEGDETYDYSSKSWYTDALAGETEGIVFSNLYQDAVTGRDVFTMSLALARTGDVVAMDVYLTGENWMGFPELADGFGLQVYDPNHTLAYSMGCTDLGVEKEDVLDQASNQMACYTGAAAEGNYNLYVYQMDSGWSVVMAIPSENLISQKLMLLMDLGLGMNVLNMVIIAVFLIRNLRNSRHLRLDALTGLLNKSYLMKHIRSRLNKSDGTLLIADLDNFKALNDSYGHDHGDLVIIQVADVLRACFRKTDCIGRFGGDEFVIYVDTVLSDDTLDRKAQEVMRQVALISRQYPRSNLSISLGGCRCRRGDKYTDVFKAADEALYQVKNGGKCGFAMGGHPSETAPDAKTRPMP